MEDREVKPGFRSGLLEVVSEAPRLRGCKAWLCRCDCGGEKVVTEYHLKTEHTKSCGCLSGRKPLKADMHIGQLTLLAEAPKRNGYRYWHCRCDCGNECTIQESHIRTGHTKSCGCLSRKHPAYSPGMKIGNLLLLEEAPHKGKGRFWNCLCDCGTECTVQESHLRSGHTKSCGCLSRKHPAYSPGIKVGNLLLLEEAPRKAGRRHWLCRCDCGNECIISESHLKTGHTKSCGCRYYEVAQARAYDLRGQSFERLKVIGLAPERINGVLKWRCRCNCGNEIYVEAEYLISGHTRSCGCLREDKRKENMQNAIHFVDGTCIEKIACQKENAANTSGHRGVTRRPNGKWRAEITFRGKRYHLGYFDDFEEAVKARLKGEEKYFGEYLEEYYARQKEG